MALLIPEKEYKIQLDKHTNGNTVNTKTIADYFGVNVSIASNRGKQLNYLQS